MQQPQVEKAGRQTGGRRNLLVDRASHGNELRIPVRAIGPLCLLTLCAILGAGLWPFHAPKNQATWIQGENGIRFGKHGTVLSTAALPMGGGDGACTVEVWIKPAKLWRTGAIVTFYNSRLAREFSIEQDFADLLLAVRSGRNEEDRRQLLVKNVFREKNPFVTLVSDGRGTMVYVDGQFVTTAPRFALSSGDLAAQVIIATSPVRDHSWSGDLTGLAVYDAALSPARVQEHYREWAANGAPMTEQDANAVAVYLFKERGGSRISNVVSLAPGLEIPEKFLVVDQLRFESPVSEFRTEDTYLKNAVINVAGFVPLGFICGLYFRAVRKVKHAGLITILIGAAVSLTIEYFQSYLPTRFSGVTDLITNTAGTWIGVMLCGLVVGRASRYWAGRSTAQPS